MLNTLMAKKRCMMLKAKRAANPALCFHYDRQNEPARNSRNGILSRKNH